ncbi:hypothetical protein SESBI_38665 [Sesbania bispinosa]|nr:hypothetical protein SESBI_38665 [Sesbania bispinosa]
MTTGRIEKQGGGAPQSEGKEEMMKPKLKKIQVELPVERVMEEEEECKTPTFAENKIPTMLKCPPAPRKKRSVPGPLSKRPHYHFSFFEDIMPGEVEFFLELTIIMNQLARANKRRRPTCN